MMVEGFYWLKFLNFIQFCILSTIWAIIIMGKWRGAENVRRSKVRNRSSSPPLINQWIYEDLYEIMREYGPTMPGENYSIMFSRPSPPRKFTKGKRVFILWYCRVCEQPEEEVIVRKDMIQCNICKVWAHCGCVGIKKTDAIFHPWFCKGCISKVFIYPAEVFPKLFESEAKAN